MVGKYSILFIVFFLVAACQTSENKDQSIEMNQLMGYWKIDQAFRNTQLTRTLDNGYFHFQPDSTLETNMAGELWQQPFTIKSGMMVHDSPFGELTYTIDSLSHSYLQMQTHIKGSTFEFICKPGKPDSIPTARPLPVDTTDNSAQPEL